MGTVTLAVLKPVKSDRMAEAGYDPETFTLYVRNHPNKGKTVGKLFAYSGVSEELADDFEKAESKGKWFNANIFKNPEYPFTEILEDAAPADTQVAGAVVDAEWQDVQTDVPAKPFVKIDLLTEDEDEDALKLQALAVKDQVQALAIQTPDEYSVAGTELVRLRAMRDLAQARVDKIRVPALETYRATLELQKDVITPYNEAEAFLNRGLAAYREQETQLRRNLEAAENRRRQAEAEAEAKRKQDEQKEADAKVAEAQGRPEEAVEIRQQTLPMAPVRWQPAVMPRDVPKVAGITERARVWKWRAKPGEEHLVPREYLMLNEKALNAAVTTQKALTSIPGIEVWDEEAPVAVSPKKAGSR